MEQQQAAKQETKVPPAVLVKSFDNGPIHSLGEDGEYLDWAEPMTNLLLGVRMLNEAILHRNHSDTCEQLALFESNYTHLKKYLAARGVTPLSNM
jgi:hypothetical protein